ncbi:ABC transporter related protein [Flexistipes sinusarabici DSM 4947]|uniref:ABC transporter related protein n=1 Tax=Flexistipes sinusarabici (strain ATCC 49648 / DSM 4947 / MAS 10) TaxID=717231 RepID=F8E7E7_FLESM|nr:ATP-binding cassette domain-containing protein [Flexistipes sinusarabici]AEI14934.1 ABC transporter related protein [Flexistipes sinusarabici DSM 4947]
MIKLENVSKKYGNNVVLDNLNINFNSGEFISIMGPSGSGKSTILNIIGAMDKPDSGKVIINNEEINRFNEEELTLFRKKHVGFIFQFFNLFNNLTVFENVQIPLLISGLKEQDSIEEILTSLNICDKL